MKQKYKKKQKKKSKRKLLFVDYESISQEELIATLKEIRERFMKHFRFHVGLENATFPTEIFEAILDTKPEELDMYKRDYWWKVLKNVMRNLRKEEELFIIHRGHKFFVLQTQEESEQYKKMLRQDIQGMIKSMKKADKWVKEKKWKENL